MSNQSSVRIAYLDIAKALLIFIVIFHHESFVARDSHIEGSLQWNFTLLPLYASWFMPAFFFITGYCTTFDKPFKEYLLSNLKTLLWPAVSIFFVLALYHTLLSSSLSAFYDDCTTIPIRGFNWFLMALFLSKLLLWAHIRFIKSDIVIGFILLLLGILAIYLNDIDYLGGNYFHHRHAAYLTFFLYCGYVFRKTNLLHDKLMASCSVIFVVAVLTCMKINGVTPGIAGTWINFTVIQIPLHLLLASTGTMFILYLSKIIGHCSLLETVGRDSLIYYLFHIDVLLLCLPLISRYVVTPTSLPKVLLVDVLTFIVCVAVCYAISWVLKNTILSKLIKL